ncbi:hypothetical protein ACOMHN_051982 [Nucella lapillus]
MIEDKQTGNREMNTERYSPKQAMTMTPGSEDSPKERETTEAEQGEDLQLLFSGGSSFAFFDSPATEEAKPVAVNKTAEVEEDEEDFDDEEGMPLQSDSRLPDTDRLHRPVQQQRGPTLAVSRDDPRLLAAVRFFKRASGEEFEDLCQHWSEERHKVMQVVRDRHKKACRRQMQLKQGAQAQRTLAKTKAHAFTKGKKK